MKTTFSLFILCIALIFVSCKKTNNTDNTTENNDTNARKGLELLADTNATNYFVGIVDGDTIILQNTKGDQFGSGCSVTTYDSVHQTYLGSSIIPKKSQAFRSH